MHIKSLHLVFLQIWAVAALEQMRWLFVWKIQANETYLNVDHAEITDQKVNKNTHHNFWMLRLSVNMLNCIVFLNVLYLPAAPNFVSTGTD